MEIINKKFLAAIESAENIVISTHSFPDADGIGSQISLCIALRQIGKNAICCNDKSLLSRYKYLDPEQLVICVEEMEERFPITPDLVIIVDTNTVQRTGSNFQKYHEKYNCNILYIDHHPCKEAHHLEHCIDTTAAATGQLVGHIILEALKIPFTPNMALPLYTAILIDTSSFRYPTVTAKTHEMVAKLMATGIEPPRAFNGINGTKKIEHMHLLGRVLSSADSTPSEEVAWIHLSKETLDQFNIDIEDTHGFINNLLILDNVKVACMFRDDGKELKLSLRSSGEYDVGFMAVQLGGGGHSHSAATVFKIGDKENSTELIDQTIKKIEGFLKNQ
jgi:phosphoesterase RecJ-like protein